MKGSILKQLKEKVVKIILDRGITCYNKKTGIMTTLLADGEFITVEADYKEKEGVIKTSLTITQNKGEYVEGECSCLDYKNRKNICKHMIALGVLSDRTKDVLEIIGTNELVMKFDEDFEQIEEKSGKKEKNSKEHEKLELEVLGKSGKSGNFENFERLKNLENLENLENTENSKNSESSENLENLKNLQNTEKNSETISEKSSENQEKISKSKQNAEKEELNLELEIDEESYSDYRYGYDYERASDFVPGYVLRLKIGAKKTYYVKDVVKFVNSVVRSENYSITNKFFYNPEIHTFSKENKKIIKVIDEFCEKILRTDVIIRDKKGLKLEKDLLDRILDSLDGTKKIYIFEKMYKKSEKYEPLFIRNKDKIIFRDIELLKDDSSYFTFKNNDVEIFKMEKNEREFLNTVGIDREFLNELLNDTEDESGLREKFLSKNINTAEYTNESGNVELLVQETNNRNILKIRISDAVKVVRKDKKYYMPRPNRELMEMLQTILEKIAISDLSTESKKSYLLDYDGLGVISSIIDEKYSDKVTIQLDSSIKKARNINVSFSVKKANNELLDFSFDIEGVEKKDVELIMESIRNEKVFVTLTSGELVKIANKNVEELLGVVDSISNLKVGVNKISKIKALQLAQISKNIKEELDEIDEFKKLFHKIKEKKEITPTNMKVELFPYQKTGFNWLKNMYDIGFGAILADDMGLGKTLQTISTLNQLYEENADFHGIVIVPTSLLYNWKEEIEKFCNINPILIEGTSRKRKEIIKNEKKGLFITTYQSLRNDVDEYKEKKFDIVVLDEAQNIKTATSKIKKAVTKLNGKVNFALTGTPIENNVLELWSIFDFVLPGYLDSLNKFKKNYKEVLVNPNSKKIENLRNIIAPFILRRTKKEVLTELPEKLDTDVVVYLSDEQKQLYLSYVKKAKKEISKFDKKENNRMKILAILTKLRQICNSPTLFKEDYNGEVAKIEVLKDLLPDIVENEHRLLIFSQFVGTLKEIEKELKNQKVEYFYIDGGIKSSERMEICKRFNDGEKQVVLISLKAGGTGLNLTGADVVIHYDPWWNIAVENQASDRAHRIGQKNSVQVIKLVTKGTIEEKIVKIQENKKILSENLLEGKDGDKALFDMNDEELMNLLS